MVLTSLPLSRGPSPSTSPTEASGAPPRQPQSAGGPLRPSPLPIPADQVQGTMPVGLPPAGSSVPQNLLGWCGWVRKMPLAPPSFARLRSSQEMSEAGDPLQPKMPAARKTPLSLKHPLSISTSCNYTCNHRRCPCHHGPFHRPHSPAEPTPLSLAWVASPQPPERSLSTPGPRAHQ